MGSNPMGLTKFRRTLVRRPDRGVGDGGFARMESPMPRSVIILAAALLALGGCATESRGRAGGSAPSGSGSSGSGDEASCRVQARQEVRRQMLADHQALDRPGISGPGLSGSMRALMADQERERLDAAYRSCMLSRGPSVK